MFECFKGQDKDDLAHSDFLVTSDERLMEDYYLDDIELDKLGRRLERAKSYSMD